MTTTPAVTPTAIADDFLRALAPHEPVAAQVLGDPAGSGLADLSPEWSAARYALEGETLARLRAVDATGLDKSERALLFAMTERLESDQRLFDTGFTPRLVAPLASPAHFVREAFDGVVINTDSGAEIVARLEAVPETMRQLQRRLLWAAERGAAGDFSGGGVVPVRQLEVLAEQVDRWIDPAGMDFFCTLEVTDDVAAELRERAALAGERATEAFAEFAAFLRGELRALAPERDAVGDEVYLATARCFLGADVDLDELSAYGWSELHRLTQRAREVAARIAGGAADADAPRRAAQLLDSRVDGELTTESAIQSWLEQRLEETIVALDGTAFDLPAEIRDVECDVTRAAAGVVYYTPGAPDGSRPGRVVWTIPRDTTALSTWQEVSSLHHEGVPGHHLEHTINRANTALHPWQRYLCEVHGYAEGWAHYSEQLSEELGLLRTDGELLGMLLGQIWRAVRVVADIGLHTGRPIPSTPLTDATEWSPEVAERMLVELAHTTPQTARFEVDRYLAWPGQALAFKVGQRLWNELRDRAASGSDFDLKTFHRDALSWGPMGLGPLAELLTEGASAEESTVEG
jgi:uncharacterized protein (DUF885 family)